ncbi:MAG: glycosyltransferase [Anaerolineales bacterium]|nr:glycosyltransferase [Anaerolineales bacterium]
MQPLISIITPSYNQADFLEQTLISVLEQDYPNVEYLVVDGASDDGSVDVIRGYAERLTWWVSEADSGQAAAINKGFSRAKGEIVAWLNSDDYYFPGTLSTVANAFASHPKAALIYGDVLSVDGAGQPIHLQHFAPYTLKDLMAFGIISQPAVFMRRSFLEQAGYLDSSYSFLLDHHLWLRMARLAPLVYLPQTLAVARYHADAKNVSRAAEFGAEAFRIAAWLESEPDFSDEYHQNLNEIMGGAHRLDAFYLVEAGRMWQGLRAYLRALRYAPRTVVRDWKRIVYAIVSLFGLGKLGRIYLKQMQKKLQPKSSHDE